MENKHDYTLEKIVDSIGLQATLERLSAIAYMKAAHLRSNWQDDKSAKVWERDAGKIDTLAAKIEGN